MHIGSRAHKELFCKTFSDGHRSYEAESLPWPELDADCLALLRGIPFWTHALQAEEDAGPMITAVARREGDPVIREALELQAYEETRHAAIIRHMIERYGLDAGDVHVEVPDDVVAAFIDFGFEEVLDSFAAFGLFKLARHHVPAPPALFDIFDQVMQEEAHHIVFFINWFRYRQANSGPVAHVFHAPIGWWHYGKAVRKLAGLVQDDDAPEGKDFVLTGATAFVESLTPQLVVSTALVENGRRLAGFDRRLLVPTLLPRLARVALAGLKILPGRTLGSRSKSDPGEAAAAENTRHAA